MPTRNTLLKDGDFYPIPVSGSFTTEEVELTGTAFTENDVDTEGCVEMTLVSDAAFEIAELVDGDGFPVAADTHFTIGVATMDSVWLKGANEQKVYVIRHFV
jgi:hypothetical protein